MPTQTFLPPTLEEYELFSPAPKKPKKRFWLLLCALGFLFLAGLGSFLGMQYLNFREEEPALPAAETSPSGFIQSDLLTIDGESRSGEMLEAVRDIAVHYVANPESSAKQNRDYFEGPDSSTSAHFIVGLEGEVIQCIPLKEKSCATNHRNLDTISIEVCHPDQTGAFLPETKESLVRLLSALLKEFGLERENIIRHYDVTGKMCPLYYVQNPEEWEALRDEVMLWEEKREEEIKFD